MQGKERNVFTQHLPKFENIPTGGPHRNNIYFPRCEPHVEVCGSVRACVCVCVSVFVGG